MAGVLMYGEIEYDSGFNYNSFKSTHDYTIIKKKYFKEPLANEFLVSSPTETSAGELVLERFYEKGDRRTLAYFDQNLNRVNMGTHKNWVYTKEGEYIWYADWTTEVTSDNEQKSVTTDFGLYKKQTNGYSKTTTQVNTEEFFKVYDSGYISLSSEYFEEDAHYYENGFLNMKTNEEISINLLSEYSKPGDDFEYSLAYIDESKVVYTFFLYYYNEKIGGGPFNGNAGIVYYNVDGSIKKMIELPYKYAGCVSTSPNGDVIIVEELTGRYFTDGPTGNRALVFEDGRIVTGKSIGSELWSSRWSADGSMLFSSGCLIDVQAGKKIMSIEGSVYPSNKSASRVLVKYGNRLRVFDINTKELIMSVQVNPYTSHFRISGDGTEIIGVSQTNYVKIRIDGRKK